jgi:hypothetical protein
LYSWQELEIRFSLQRQDLFWGPPSPLYYCFWRLLFELKRLGRKVTNHIYFSIEIKNAWGYRATSTPPIHRPIDGIMTRHLRAEIMEPNQTSNARQRLGKHIPAATNTHATTEQPLSRERTGKHATILVLLETVFSVPSVERGYKEEFS